MPTRILQEIADSHGEGRIVSVLEGSYNDGAVELTCPNEYTSSYHGLSSCAASHLAAAVTGEQQEENPFYANPESFLCLSTRVEQPVALQNGRGTRTPHRSCGFLTFALTGNHIRPDGSFTRFPVESQ